MNNSKRIILILILIISHIAYSQESDIFNQPPIANDSKYTSSKSRTSLSIGYTENDFHYGDSDIPFTYDFQTSFPVLLIAWKSTILSVGYGKQSVKKLGTIPPLNMFEARLTTGGKINLFSRFLGMYLGTFVPITINFRYCDLLVKDNNISEIIPDLHLLNTDLGLGIGLKFRPTFESKFSITSFIVSSIGGLINFENSSSQEILLSRSTEINFDFQVERLFFNKVGLTLGYNFISQRWTDENLNVLKSIINIGDIPKRRGQNIYRIGINW